MVSASAVKTKIDTVVSRTDLRRNIVVNHYTSATNAFGEDILTFSSQETFTGIILNYRSYKHKFDPEGDFSNSEFIIYLSTDDSISKTDIIEMFNSEYIVEGIDKFPLGTLLVAQRIFVSEKLD